MTIQEFIDECSDVVRNLTIHPSIEEGYIRGTMVEGIIAHFKKKGFEVKELTWTATEFGYTTTEKIQLSTGQEIELEMEFIFGTVVKKTGNIIPVSPTRSKYEKVAGDKPVKFKKVKVDYRVPAYEMENDKIIRDGFFAPRYAKLTQNVRMTDDSKAVLSKVDVSEIEGRCDESICQPILNEVLWASKSVPGTEQFIDVTNGKVDTKGLADFIRHNLM